MVKFKENNKTYRSILSFSKAIVKDKNYQTIYLKFTKHKSYAHDELTYITIPLNS